VLTGVSLFAGVGGFDLAMERNGVNVVANVEIDKHCQSLLERKFPDAKQFNDVTTVTGKGLNRCRI
jgi:DNA (cytosine-5)-methyltransferase 1